ncbi:hypothetical protein MHK_002040 [Candidatus Magnetomorum sp. HK-1]|nr:hypothetical protein MHK_002040 [Candidatus Magnetomorum sp. HK-1]
MQKLQLSKININLLILMEMSWQMWKTEKAYLSSKVILSFLARICSAKGILANKSDLENLLNKNSSFKMDRNGNLYFIDQYFMDYFLAKRLYLTFRKLKMKGIHKLLNARCYDNNVLYFLSVLDQKTNIIHQPLQKIIQNEYIEKVTENALHIYCRTSKFKQSLMDENSMKNKQNDTYMNITNVNLTQNVDFSLEFKNNTINTTNSSVDDKSRAAQFFNCGINLLKENKNFEALEPFFVAKALDPDCIKAANNLAIVFKNLGSINLAKQMAQRVLLEEPDNNRAKEHLKYLNKVEQQFQTKRLEDLRK